jgi:hypothetical protein
MRVFNKSLVSNEFTAAPLLDLALLVCSGIIPLDNHTNF